MTGFRAQIFLVFLYLSQNAYLALMKLARVGLSQLKVWSRAFPFVSLKEVMTEEGLKILIRNRILKNEC